MASDHSTRRERADAQSTGLEADVADERTIRQQAEAFDDIDMNVVNAGDDGVERAYPSAAQTRERQEELTDMLDESVNRDPEALASDEARIHSPHPEGGLTPSAMRFFDKTTELTPDDFDGEDLIDQASDAQE